MRTLKRNLKRLKFDSPVSKHLDPKLVDVLVNLDTVGSLVQYLKRRMDHMNRQYIYLFNPETREMLRMHAFTPNLTKSEFQGTGQISFYFQ